MHLLPASWTTAFTKLAFATTCRRFKRPTYDKWRRHLRLEHLEDRQMLSITVNTLADDHVNGFTTLREALANAAATDTIDFSVTGTINLTHGELLITKNLTISGPGANLLTIDASGNDPTPTIDDNNGSRVFEINDGQNNVLKAATISGVTITGADATFNGGGIYAAETLTLNNCVIRGNHAYNYGGGIQSGIVNNGALAQGLTITNTTISGNSAASGGGIYYFGGSNQSTALHLSIVRCTIDSNSATGHGSTGKGGGIGVIATPSATIADSTITNNVANRIGGGIHLRSLSTGATLRNLTVTKNRSLQNEGGGIYTGNYPAILLNSIVSGNTSPDGTMPNNITGTLPTASSYNLIGTGGNGALYAANGNLLNVDDALLGPLQDNGGPTRTQIPAPSSPAIDHGDPFAPYDPSATDQRGQSFSRFLNGRLDIGAVESPGSVITPLATLIPTDLSRVVRNLDFERFIRLPTSYNAPPQFDMMSNPYQTVIGWQQLTAATTDYYNANPGGFMGLSSDVSFGAAGTASPPPNGSKGFVALIYQDPSSSLPEWHEYAVSTLASPLSPGRSYHLNIYAGTTAANGDPGKGGAFNGELVVYGLVDASLISSSLYKGTTAKVEEFAVANAVELLSKPVDLPAGTWTTFADQVLSPTVPIQAIVFGIRTNSSLGYLLVDASQSSAVPALPGDYNLNGVVDAADYTVWRDHLGSTVTPFAGADGDGSGVIDQADYDVWKTNFGRTTNAGAGAAQVSGDHGTSDISGAERSSNSIASIANAKIFQPTAEPLRLAVAPSPQFRKTLSVNHRAQSDLLALLLSVDDAAENHAAEVHARHSDPFVGTRDSVFSDWPDAQTRWNPIAMDFGKLVAAPLVLT